MAARGRTLTLWLTSIRGARCLLHARYAEDQATAPHSLAASQRWIHNRICFRSRLCAVLDSAMQVKWVTLRTFKCNIQRPHATVLLSDVILNKPPTSEDPEY